MKTQGKIWLFFDAEQKIQSKPMSIVQAQVFLLSIAPEDNHKYFVWTPGWDQWLSIHDFLHSTQKYFVLGKPSMPTQPQVIKEDTVTSTRDHSINTAVTQTSATNSSITHTGESAFTKIFDGESPLRDVDFGYYHADFNGDDLDVGKMPVPKVDKKKKKPSLDKEKQAESKTPAGIVERRKLPRHDFKIKVVLVSKLRTFSTYSKDMSLSGTKLEDEIPKDFLNKPFDLIIVNPFDPDPAKAKLLFRAKIVGDLSDARRLMFIEQDVEMTSRLDALLKAYVAYQKQIRKTAG